MLTIIIIAVVAYVAFAIYNIVDGNKIERSAQSCKAIMDGYHAREQEIADRKARKIKAQQDEYWTERKAAEKAERMARENRVYRGTTVTLRDGSEMDFDQYRSLSNWN